ncbi:MAG TPA: hypothetical protein DHW78_02700 [Ruminococcaceae bacterium]|jgi:hypothetical protein|nr:Dabb family protein [Oscillospiraceae bacterium]HCA72093.1 hypothetical protein [Oscillospiraceae bacterium]HCC01588.1 hypothetical protein [Oscillospiraceae bacterium]HCM23225.1 hypothetical protein [Oscillospiraceae bacterium]
MVKHIVLWKLNESQRGNAAGVAASLRSRFKSLLGVVDGLTAIEVGLNYKSGDYDLCLIADFSDKGAEAAYQNHPEHLKIKKLVHSLVCARTSFDYEYTVATA